MPSPTNARVSNASISVRKITLNMIAKKPHIMGSVIIGFLLLASPLFIANSADQRQAVSMRTTATILQPKRSSSATMFAIPKSKAAIV